MIYATKLSTTNLLSIYIKMHIQLCHYLKFSDAEKEKKHLE